MKIAIVGGGCHVFGKEIISLELGAGLKEAGHEVTFVSSRWWGEGRFPQRLRELGLSARFMRLGFISATLSWDCIRMTLDQLIRVPSLWWNYWKFLREVRPEHVIHTNWHHLIMLWPFLNRRRDWYWLHDVVLDKPQYRTLYRALARRMRGFIPVSEAVKASLLRIGITEQKSHVIHNGIADPAGRLSGVKSWKGVRVGIVGQVAPWKGHQDLLEAFGRVAAAHADATLHLFGDDSQPFAQGLKQRAGELGIADRLVWHGFVSDKERMFGQMDVCVAPSTVSEALPTVAIEAAFFGVPVIASRVGGMPEIVEDGKTGLLFEAGQRDQLAGMLGRLLADVNDRREMGAAAREQALRLFSRGRFVADFERCLRSHDCFLQA